MSDIEERRNYYAESDVDENDGVILSDEEAENQNEEQENNENQSGNEGTHENNDEENKEDENKKIVKPKRVVRNPQPKLNAETLRGPRGLTALNAYFKDIKYKGKGHEIEDLQVILKSYEHWCHRLFPKLPFDDCIKKLETLGNKKPVITYMKKIRLGMEEIETNPEQINQEADDLNDQFNDKRDDAFDRLLVDNEETIRPTLQMQQQNKDDDNVALTEEQLERIRINRERALEIKRRKMQQIANNISSDVTDAKSTSTEPDRITETEHSAIVTNDIPNGSANVEAHIIENVTETAKTNNQPLVPSPENIPIISQSTKIHEPKIIQNAVDRKVIFNTSSVEIANEITLQEISEGSEHSIITEVLSENSSTSKITVLPEEITLKPNSVHQISSTVSEVNDMDID